MASKGGTVFKGVLLVAGTSVGGGMLALPVLTSLGGFIPSLVVYFFCWLFMASTGLLFLEIALSMDEGANIISMSEKTLGKFGKFFSWILYLFLFYCLSLAYTVGCGDLVAQAFGDAIPESLGALIFVCCFAPIVFAGTKFVGKINIFMMGGLIVTFLAFVFLGFKHVKSDLLLYRNWSYSLMALPIAFTSFAYQGIIPTLVTYLDRNVAHIRKSIVIGSFIPLLTYVIWQGLIQGIVPTEGPGGLAESLAREETAVHSLRRFTQAEAVTLIGQFFAFFALVTSFFGVTLGLLDFLADGLKIQKTPSGKLLLCLMIFVPSLLLTYTYPHLFLTALGIAGGYGCALLLGLLPILMVWVARYHLHASTPYRFFGGKTVLLLLLAFVLFELVCQIVLSLI